jgi:bacillithiol biosynthesis deacetylase BshB1
MKLDILVIAVHPDDAELSCAGTILKQLSLGYKVGILDLTAGELGTRGNANIRAMESANATKILGIHTRDNVFLEDGFFELNHENKLKIIPFIRKYQPDIVLCNAVSDRHPDHGRAAKLASDACFLSGLKKIETSFKTESQQPWRPKNVYHYIQEHNLAPDFVVDISEFIDKKIEAIMAFKSQFYDPESKEPETPISKKSYVDFIKAKAMVYGNTIGVEYGEGFTVNRSIGVDNLYNIK